MQSYIPNTVFKRCCKIINEVCTSKHKTKQGLAGKLIKSTQRYVVYLITMTFSSYFTFQLRQPIQIYDIVCPSLSETKTICSKC